MLSTSEPLYIDSREPDSLIKAFEEHGFFENIIVTKLDTGDLKFGKLVVERKSFIDYLNSWREGRLNDQVERLVNLKDEVGIIIVHDYKKSDRWIKPGLRAAGIKHLDNINFVVPVYKVNDIDGLVNKLMLFAKHALDGKYLFDFEGRKVEARSAPNRIVYLYASLPGVGQDLAKKLYKKYPNPCDLIDDMKSVGMLNQPEGRTAKLRKKKMWHYNIKGLGDKKAKDLEEMLLYGKK